MMVWGLAAGMVLGCLTAPGARADAGAGFAYFCDQDQTIPRAVHVVKIDRSRKDLELHVTLGGYQTIGLANLVQHVRSIPAELGQPVAAINGDYWDDEDTMVGAPMGLCIRRGELITGPGVDRAFMCLDAQGQLHLTNATAQFTVTWPDGKTTPIGLNQSLGPGDAVLYSPAAGASTKAQGIELILTRHGSEPWLPLRIGQTFTAKVRQVNSSGDSPIGATNLVLSLGPRLSAKIKPVPPGSVLKISLATTPDLTGATLALGGGPSLVREGKARTFSEVSARHPRSAIGWNDKFFFFVQVDGRQPRYSMGMTLEELAAYCVKLGCDYALNLDGGASCTTWVNGKVVNSPCGRNGLRPFGSGLVLVRKKP